MFIRFRLPVLFLILVIGLYTACFRMQDGKVQKHLFDLNWKYYPGDTPLANKLEFNDQHWQEIDLPHQWNENENLSVTRNDTNEDAKTESITGWYRKSFTIPPNWHNKHITIQFDCILSNTHIYINGHSLSKNSNSTNHSLFDLTPYLNYQKNNIIAINFKNSISQNTKPEKLGIYDHVWLLVSETLITENRKRD